MASVTVSAIILAAGASTRMGTPKALLRWQGDSFVHRLVRLAQAVYCGPIVVVAGAHEIPREELGQAYYLHHQQWREGQLSSLQTGIRYLYKQARVDGTFVLTIDRPHVKQTTLITLMQAFGETPQCIVQPQYHEQHGHPLLYPAWLFLPMLNLAPESSARHLLVQPEYARFRRFITVDDRAVVDNIDTPEDLKVLKSGA